MKEIECKKRVGLIKKNRTKLRIRDFEYGMELNTRPMSSFVRSSFSISHPSLTRRFYNLEVTPFRSRVKNKISLSDYVDKEQEAYKFLEYMRGKRKHENFGKSGKSNITFALRPFKKATD